MNIQEAAKIAHQQGTGIFRKGWPFLVYILPTNTAACCLIVKARHSERKAVLRWEPTLNDLTADDWQVYGAIEQSEKLGDKVNNGAEPIGEAPLQFGNTDILKSDL